MAENPPTLIDVQIETIAKNIGYPRKVDCEWYRRSFAEALRVMFAAPDPDKPIKDLLVAPDGKNYVDAANIREAFLRGISIGKEGK